MIDGGGACYFPCSQAVGGGESGVCGESGSYFSFSGPVHGYIAAGARLAGGGADGVLLVTPLEGGTGPTGKRADTGRERMGLYRLYSIS